MRPLSASRPTALCRMPWVCCFSSISLTPSYVLHHPTACPLRSPCSTSHIDANNGVIAVARFQAAECGYPNDSRSDDVIIVMSALYGVAAFFVLLRVLSKLITHTFCADDYMIILAVVLSAAPFACVLYSQYTPVPANRRNDC